MQAGHNDHKAFKPHADVDEDRNHKHERNVRPQLLEPEKLRGNYVAGKHRPVSPPVGAEGAVDEGKQFIWVAGIPGDKEFSPVGIPNDGSGHQHDFVHVFEMLDRNQVLEMKPLAEDNHQRHHHGKAAEHCARDKVRRENRSVPAGQHRHGEVETDDGMNTEHKRR